MSKISEVFNKCMYKRKDSGAEPPSRKSSKSNLLKDKHRDKDKADDDEDYEARALELSSQHDMYMPSAGGSKHTADVVDGRSDKFQPYSQHGSDNTLATAHGQSQHGDEYTRQLEADLDYMQRAYLNLTANHARMQFRLRQIVDASPYERGPLLRELEQLVFEDRHPPDPDEMPNLQRDMRRFGTIRRKQNDIIAQLRMQLDELSDAIDMELDRSEQHNVPGEDKEKGHKSVRQQGGGHRRSSQEEYSDVPLTLIAPTYIRTIGGQQYGTSPPKPQYGTSPPRPQYSESVRRPQYAENVRRLQHSEPVRRPHYPESVRRQQPFEADRPQQQVEVDAPQPPPSVYQRIAAFQQKRCDYVYGE